MFFIFRIHPSLSDSLATVAFRKTDRIVVICSNSLAANINVCIHMVVSDALLTLDSVQCGAHQFRSRHIDGTMGHR